MNLYTHVRVEMQKQGLGSLHTEDRNGFPKDRHIQLKQPEDSDLNRKTLRKQKRNDTITMQQQQKCINE